MIDKTVVIIKSLVLYIKHDETHTLVDPSLVLD